MSTPLETLRHHVTGAIERGEAVAIAGIESQGNMKPEPTNAETVWNNLPPVNRSIVTSRYAFGLRSDAKLCWQDIPADRRAGYQKNIKQSDILLAMECAEESERAI